MKETTILTSQLTIWVPGIPVPKERARKGKDRKGKAIWYTPTPTKDYESFVQARACIAKQEQGFYQAARFKHPVHMQMTFFLPVPATWPKWKQEAASDGRICPTSKPDIDNLAKCIMDALNMVAYKDDSIVVSKDTSKHYCTEIKKTGAHVTITPMTDRFCNNPQLREIDVNN